MVPRISLWLAARTAVAPARAAAGPHAAQMVLTALRMPQLLAALLRRSWPRSRSHAVPPRRPLVPTQAPPPPATWEEQVQPPCLAGSMPWSRWASLRGRPRQQRRPAPRAFAPPASAPAPRHGPRTASRSSQPAPRPSLARGHCSVSLWARKPAAGAQRHTPLPALLRRLLTPLARFFPRRRWRRRWQRRLSAHSAPT